jgi:hypothetical protein
MANFSRAFMRTARLFAALTLVIPLATGLHTPSVAACSGGVPLPEDRFVPGALPEVSGIEPYGIALLGEVEEEIPIPDHQTPLFLSTVRTVVPFGGEGITAVVRVGPNGNGFADCSGGPRLFPGEKVALFLYPAPAWLAGEEDPGRYGDWQSGQLGTPVLFEGGDAYYLSWGRFAGQVGGVSDEQREYVGKAEDVLKLILDYFGATEGQRADAFAFVLGTTAARTIQPPDTGDAGLADSLAR